MTTSSKENDRCKQKIPGLFVPTAMRLSTGVGEMALLLLVAAMRYTINKRDGGALLLQGAPIIRYGLL